MKEETVKNTNQIPKEQVRLRLDSDVADFFKSLDNYEEVANKILREHVDARRTRK